MLDGWWTDAGTFESLLVATNLVAESVAKKEAALQEKILPLVRELQKS